MALGERTTIRTSSRALGPSGRISPFHSSTQRSPPRSWARWATIVLAAFKRCDSMLIMRPIQLHEARQPKPGFYQTFRGSYYRRLAPCATMEPAFFEIAELPLHEDARH